MPVPIHFYYPAAKRESVPTDLGDFAAWQKGLAADGVTLGPSAWILQTYLHLKARGFPSTLATDLPNDGIVIAHRANIPKPVAMSRDRFWVCVLADRPPPHPYCNFHILQNPAQFLLTGQAFAYVPHWTQSGLVPRDRRRAGRVENVHYFGETENLVSELASANALRWFADNGFRFEVVARDRWHDYSDCDAALAIRTLGPTQWHHSKPATKLVNAWLAGVPAILGTESAFRAEGRVGIDYLEARTFEDIQHHLLALRSDPGLRDGLVERGRESAARFSPDAIARQWTEVIEREILPRYERWRTQFALRSAYIRATSRLWEGLGWRTELTTSRIKGGNAAR